MPTETLYEATSQVQIADIIADLLFEFPKLDEQAAIHYTRRAAIKIAQDGMVIRRQTTICTQHCVERYRLEPMDCHRIHAILSVCKLHGCNSGHGEIIRMPSRDCGFRCGTKTWFEEPDNFYIHQPCDCGTFEVDFAVVPLNDACALDAVFENKYHDLLILGARSYIYSLGGKPWTNQSMARALQQDFETGISVASVDTMLGGQRGALWGLGKFIV